MRAAATRIYSRAWDEPARRGLTDLLRKAGRSSGETVPTKAGARARVVISRG